MILDLYHVREALTNLCWIRIPTLDSIKASGNWMWAAKLPGEGPKMYDIAEALSHIMVELGIAIDGGKDVTSASALFGSSSERLRGFSIDFSWLLPWFSIVFHGFSAVSPRFC